MTPYTRQDILCEVAYACKLERLPGFFEYSRWGIFQFVTFWRYLLNYLGVDLTHVTPRCYKLKYAQPRYTRLRGFS